MTATTSRGSRLLAAMYVLERGTPLQDVPPFGGCLVQWHTHENLCYSPEGYVQGIADIADIAGDRAPGA